MESSQILLDVDQPLGNRTETASSGSGAWNHEALIQWPLFKESGGGTLYKQKDLVYKRVKEERSLRNLPALHEALMGKFSTWLAAPKHLVHDASNRITGFIMATAPGIPLEQYQGDSTFPLVEVIGRVATVMLECAAAGLIPHVEHAGNVMVDISES
eukprot:11805103-Karenia_brevis.AAC.1